MSPLSCVPIVAAKCDSQSDAYYFVRQQGSTHSKVTLAGPGRSEMKCTAHLASGVSSLPYLSAKYVSSDLQHRLFPSSGSYEPHVHMQDAVV
jgi:hypothetical protein